MGCKFEESMRPPNGYTRDNCAPTHIRTDARVTTPRQTTSERVLTCKCGGVSGGGCSVGSATDEGEGRNLAHGEVVRKTIKGEIPGGSCGVRSGAWMPRHRTSSCTSSPSTTTSQTACLRGTPGTSEIKNLGLARLGLPS
eukprot:3549259-Rhodomonas_salina.2